MKTKILIIIIFLIVSIALASYYFWKNDYKDWITYNTTEFDMSFKYPSNWNMHWGLGTVIDDDKRIIVSDTPGESIDLRVGETLVAFEVYPNKESNTVNNIISCKDIGEVKLIECGEDKIGGTLFKKQIMVNRNVNKTLSMAAIQNGKLYQIEVFGDVYNQIAKKMIKSVLLK